MKALMIFFMVWPVWALDNKQLVEDFYRKAFMENKPLQAAREYLHPGYIQHNPYAATGREGFIQAFKDFDLSGYSFDIKRVVGEGELVVLHLHVKKNKTDRGSAVVDIFRVKNNKIVEHWDVMQKVPEITAHDNTMF